MRYVEQYLLYITTPQCYFQFQVPLMLIYIENTARSKTNAGDRDVLKKDGPTVLLGKPNCRRAKNWFESKIAWWTLNHGRPVVAAYMKLLTSTRIFNPKIHTFGLLWHCTTTYHASSSRKCRNTAHERSKLAIFAQNIARILVEPGMVT